MPEAFQAHFPIHGAREKKSFGSQWSIFLGARFCIKCLIIYHNRYGPYLVSCFQALVREQQKTQEVTRLQEVINKILREAGKRTREEVKRSKNNEFRCWKCTFSMLKMFLSNCGIRHKLRHLFKSIVTNSYLQATS